jgi:hypothetical protein
MLALTAPRIKASMQSRLRQLELTEAVIAKSRTVIQQALQDEDCLSRDALVTFLNEAGIPTDDNRASHLFMVAELDGLICSGRLVKGRQTYALLEKRTPKTGPLSKADAPSRLARTYFTSHGPATLKDFAWWSGLSLGEASRGFEMVQSGFTSEIVDGTTYWFHKSNRPTKGDDQQVYLLPAFDEFIISYADRRAALPEGVSQRLVSDNGMFRPVVVVDSLVLGVWKRTIKKDQVFIEVELFASPPKGALDGIEAAATKFAAFLEKELAEIRRSPP